MITKYFQNLTAGAVFHATDAPGSIPEIYYLGLSTTEPTPDGTNVTEPSSSAGYQRVPISALKMATESPGVVTNASAIATSEATVSWGVITHALIYDAATEGNLLAYDALDTPKTVEANSLLMIKVESLRLSIEPKP